ncbi:xanthine dehydrogenase molybdopterin binding subunit [Pseudogemmobacter faecipullorum]|uniref:Xanthine dehydrogenase molybdopterin binding subunit n=1 Tax=Pseudogemmobacter faecipullorum TaxID=2755041 RepID=A0ABS8CKL8_9RHOB|nr:xanthine dehydrogenase molybdopterin binding subunit [Pseudogemmobacter faecipullorum]MCB5409938.1 xanthine dehydrogenase molybdopterin binding subunit [Pseudogemmobacter faecipullorum]
MSRGQPLPHDSAPLHVTGAARFADDIPLPAGCLHLAFGLSEIACGQIEEMDLSAVHAAPGVVRVITAQDLRARFGAIPDCAPAVPDEPLLSDTGVEYHGRPLFIVVAESHLAARKAARRAKIRYRETKPVLSIDEALEANSRFEQGPVIWARGDAEGAISQAPHQLEGRFEVGGQEHFYLEGQIALALPLEDGMHITASTQHPTEIQHKVAHALHLPMSAVRVETRRMGGGFGGKESQGNWLAVASALAAQITGRACKMRYDRDDDMVITGKRHDLRILYRVGYDDQGRILGLDFTHLMRCGWSQDLSLAVADRAMLHADNCYLLENIRIESHRLKTNTASATAFRGFGGPQGMIGIEQVMDHVAFALGREPLAVRRANFYKDFTDISPGAGRIQTTPYAMEVEDFIGNALVARLEASSAYQARRAAVRAWNASSPFLKRGLALTPVKFGISFTLTWLNQAGALLHLYQDGSLALNHGGTEMGQGLNQKVAQVVAEIFGVQAGEVKITATDTAKVPNTSATAASSGSDLNGAAAREAALTIRQRLAGFMADKHGVAPEAVRFEDGMVRVAGESHPLSRVATWAWQARISLSSTGYYATPKITWDRVQGQGRPFLYFAYGAAVTEVVIDTLTGENRILRADILHDTGSPLNPALDIGQIEGGYVQGAGWLTSEELVWDEKGRLRTHAPSTYKIPACADRPRVFNVALWDAPAREATIGRSKAVGEPPLMLGISAFAALQDAVAEAGGRRIWPALTAPATPEAVLAALTRVQRDV